MKRSAINLIFLLALTGSSWGAVPLIKEFSSSGGNPANKDNDQDIMYLVQPGDSISFRVTADQQVSYEWTVNKSTKAGRGVTVPAVSDIFNWTAPDEKGVWEIHLRCWNTLSEETQKEWVVSTLTLAEAPVIFESFSDGKYNKRADTDPWGRTFNWTSPSGSLSGRVFTQVTANDLKGLFLSGAIGKDFGIYINSDVLYGTWDFYFRFPNGGNTAYNDNLYVYPASANAIPSFPLIKLYHAADEHIGTDYFDGNGKWHPFTTRDHNGAAYSALGSISDICEGNSIGIGTGWHRMRFIRDKRTGYNLLWQGLETVEEPFIAENFYYSKDLEKAKSLFFGLNEDGAATDGVNSLQQIDQIAVYNEIYLYPKKKVVVSPTKITVKNGLDPSSLWNLKELAHAVNDVSKMKYSDDTKTGYVHVDTLDFNYATGFEMNNETLVFTSTNNPQWKWRSGLYMKLNHVKVIGQNNILLIDASNVETIRNKKVKNKMHIDISSSSFININGPKFNNGSVSMQHLSISNSYFLLNKTATRGRPMALAFGFSQNELYNWDIMLNNNIFEMTKGAFQGVESEALIRLGFSNPYFYNSVFKGGLGFRVSQGSGNCINCNLTNAVLYDQSSAGSLYVKYYADIAVKDKNGGSLSNIRLDIHNEVDDTIKHDIENLLLPQNHWEWYDDPPPNKWYHRRATFDEANEQSTFHTGRNGHTELPAWESNSVVLMDYIKDLSGKRNYTYSISAFDPNNIWTDVPHTIYPDGTIQQLKPLAKVTGVDPNDSWYRPDPNTARNSTVLQIKHTRTKMTVNANQNAVNITVNKWDTSLPQGDVLVNFTADTPECDDVSFTIGALKPNVNYLVRRDGAVYTSIKADSTGKIIFDDSVWKEHAFSIVEKPTATELSLDLSDDRKADI